MSREKAGWLRSFLKSAHGNVAMMFALALVPLMIGAGVGLDYARAMLVRQQMSEALDAAALAVGSTAGLSQDDALALAKRYFNANYTVDQTVYGTPAVSIGSYNSTGSVTITASDSMPTVLVKLIGFNSLTVSTSSNVVWGQTKLWVALVLDNSGSMSDGDSAGSKMTALKSAANQLLTILQNAASNPGDVQVSIVPFVKTVNVGKTNVSASWVDWSDWDSPPITDTTNYVYQQSTDAVLHGHPLNTFGPGDACPYDGSAGYKCASSPANDANCTGGGGSDCIATIPASGTYAGYICPSMQQAVNQQQNGLAYHYYNGCWVATTFTGNTVVIATGSSANCDDYPAQGHCGCATTTSVYKGYPAGTHLCTAETWNMSWVSNGHSSWTGCLMDRKKDYDIANTTPGAANTLFPAENNYFCGLAIGTATITPLGYNWTNLSNQVNAMTANGSTNQAIAIAHGWQTLTPGNPYGAPAVPADTTRYMIVLSDGLNTQDRWWGDANVASIDAREKSTCDAAKADGVIIYAIYINIGQSSGNSAPLVNCASDATKYFSLSTTGAVVTTFQQIAQQITNLRVVK